MSTNFKKSSSLLAMVLLCKFMIGQTLELPAGFATGSQVPVTNSGLGPITAFNTSDSINLMLDAGGNNFSTPTAAQTTKVFMQFINQQYSGLRYNNISNGLLFGATATTAYDGGIPETSGGARQPQQVEPFVLYNEIGTYNTPGSGTGNDNGGTNAPGGPWSNMFSAGLGSINTGITAIWNGSNGINDGNGAFSAFTVAQVQYDGGDSIMSATPPPYPKNTVYAPGTRYYYGDLVVSFNRYIKNPIVHFAGLGGAYRYLIPGGTAGNASDWRSTYFATELECVGFTLQRLSGNDYFEVSGSNITNDALLPSGGSSIDPASLTYPFEDFGAGSGSVRVNGIVRSIVFKVYLRGATVAPGQADFAWSTYRKNTSVYNREPVTGDLWWVSVSTKPEEIIILSTTGVTLNAALNGNDVALNWKTLTESNTKSFDIERSINGVNYIKVGEKAAAGNSVSDINYNFVDPRMEAPVYYYRLKMNELDGKFTYSNVAIVRKGAVKGIKTFPNPATDHVNIEFSNLKGAYTVSLINQAGQQVYNRKVDINSNVQYVRIDRGMIASGMYHVVVRDLTTGTVQSEKVLLK